MNIAKTIAKNTLFGAVETGTDLITTFILGIFLARSLGAEQYGVYAYLTWLGGLVVLLADVGLGETAKRYIAEALGKGNHNEAVGIIRLTLGLRSAAAIVIGVGLALSSIYWPASSISSESRHYFLIIALLILPQGVHYAFISIFRGFQKYEYAAYVTMFTAPLRLLLIAILLYAGFGIQEVLIVQVASFVLGTFIGLHFLGRLTPLKELFSKFHIDKSVRQRAVKYTLTIAGIMLVSYFASNQLSSFFIEKYCPVDQVGFFRLAMRTVSIPATLLPTAFSFVLTPAIAEQFGKGNFEKIKAVYLASARYLMLLSFPLQAGLIAIASPIIKLMYGAEFAPTIPIMQILLIPSAVVSISNVALAVIYGTNRPRSVFKIYFLFAVYSIGMSFWLIPRYGVWGAAIINAIPLSSILIIILACKRTGTGWPVADTLKIITASLLMGLAVFFLQTQFSLALSLALGIPSGIVIYIALIFLFRVVHEEDIGVLKKIQGTLPLPLRGNYGRLTELAERIVKKKKDNIEL